MANRDVDVRSDTWTRAELLTQRGYPEAIVNGNGRHDSGKPTPATATAVAIPTDEPAESGARSCSECGGPVAVGRQTTCSSECAKVARRRRDRERKRARPTPASVSPSVSGASPGPELVTIAPPAELVNMSAHRTLAELEASDAGGMAVSLADELEACAGLLRRIARRLTS